MEKLYINLRLEEIKEFLNKFSYKELGIFESIFNIEKYNHEYDINPVINIYNYIKNNKIEDNIYNYKERISNLEDKELVFFTRLVEDIEIFNSNTSNNYLEDIIYELSTYLEDEKRVRDDNLKNKYKILKKYLCGKREKTLLTDEVNMYHAIITSSNSKDPSTQVGACYVNTKGEIISLGYNHPPKRWDINNFPWSGNVKEIGIENTKYPYIVHAEIDGIINHKGNKEELIDSTLYVTLFPCSNCAKHIAEAGIKKIVYLNEREEDIDKIEAKRIFNACNIEIVNFKELNNNYKTIELDTTQNEKNNIKLLKKEM